MSLTLRKKTQDSLNDANLDDYHTRIDNNKYLAIVGPCGQPLITISGIEFTRREPTVAETDFACELFAEFLQEHKQDIEDYILKMKKHKQSKEPPMSNKIFGIDSDGYGTNNYNFVLYKDAGCKIRVHLSGKGETRIKRIEVPSTNGITRKTFLDFKPDEALLDGAVTFLREWTDFCKSAEELEVAKTKLSTCDI